MSALLDELRSVLSVFRQHVADSINSGMLVTLDGHLDRLAAAAENGIQAADDAVKGVLGELYSALHGSAPEAPAAPAAPAPAVDVPVAAPADVPAPAADGGLVSAPGPVLIGESGPETLVLPADADTDTPTAG